MSAPSRGILSLQLQACALEALTHAAICQKVVEVFQLWPQVISGHFYDEIFLTLATCCQLVTLANPQRCGLRDTLLPLPQKHPIAVDAYQRMYDVAIKAE